MLLDSQFDFVPGRRIVPRVWAPAFALLSVISLFTCTVPAQSLTPGLPEDVGMSSDRLALLDTVIEQAIASQEARGAVMLVGRRGKIVYRKTFGDRAVSPAIEPMTPDTIFDMASLTKVFATATSVLTLVERGGLSLTDPVKQYLPEFTGDGRENVTVLQLLTHHSGLRPDLDLDEPWTGYETGIQLALQEKLVAVPGRRFIYSDINYILLGEIVHQVSGMRLDEYALQNVFQPLGLGHTRFNPPAEWRDRIAPSEPRDGVMLRGSVHDPTSGRMEGAAGHAGLFSTIDDTAVFAQMILNSGNYGSTRLLSPLTVRQMTTNQSPSGSPDWRGFGFDIRTRFSTPRGDVFPVGSFGHTGFTGTSLWIDPESETFVILFTSRLHPDGKGDVVGLRKKVGSIVASAIIDWEGSGSPRD